MVVGARLATAVFAVAIFFWLRLGGAFGIDVSEFYPYGSDIDGSLKKADDASSAVVTLSVPIIFYGQRKYSLTVYTNGYISFDRMQPTYVDQRLPLGYDAILPLYADFDSSNAGDIYYRESTDAKLLEDVAARITTAFGLTEPFRPQSVFVATWDNVGSYDAQIDQVNTVQLVIATSGFDSYTLFLYAEDGIQWITAMSKNSTAHMPAQVGFDGTSRDRVYTVAVSGTDEVDSLATTSNLGTPGVWAFHMGNVREVTEPRSRQG